VAPAESFAGFLERTRLLLDEALGRWLPAPPACPAILSEAMRYSVFAGGKRLRPTLTLAAADAVAKDGMTLALPAACAVEMIHTYSLIHDDLPSMDNDTLRRGRPTLHVVYGDGLAVLAGDGLQAEAFALLGREPHHDGPARTDAVQAADLLTRKLRTLSVIAQAAGAVGMVGGQAIDLQAAGQTTGRAVTLDAEGLQAMHARKTGAMIRASAAAGAIMAGGDDTTIAAVTSYAAEIGLAFQIVDDILDVEGSAQQLGKTAGKDAAGAKPTYVALYGLDRSRVLADDCLARAHDALERAGLTNGHLGAIGDWAVRRKT
jgi:geranylgeranyl pyrophosphate synthase